MKDAESRVAEIATSYIYMMMNRLFYEKARVHELIIYEFLRRYYASETARAKNTANNNLNF